jgi:hypothetical protein
LWSLSRLSIEQNSDGDSMLPRRTAIPWNSSGPSGCLTQCRNRRSFAECKRRACHRDRSGRTPADLGISHDREHVMLKFVPHDRQRHWAFPSPGQVGLSRIALVVARRSRHNPSDERMVWAQLGPNAPSAAARRDVFWPPSSGRTLRQGRVTRSADLGVKGSQIQISPARQHDGELSRRIRPAFIRPPGHPRQASVPAVSPRPVGRAPRSSCVFRTGAPAGSAG